MTLTLDPFVPDRDAALLHAWVTTDRARFWMMQERTVEEVHEIYTWLDEQPTHHVWWVRRDGEPVALFQDYAPSAEEVGATYDVRPGDLGVHFMLAEATVTQPGFTGEVIAFLMERVFADPTVGRIVVEPDARNDKAVARVTRLGFELGPVVELSTKPAQLAFLTREAYSAFSKKASA
jgi:RimJ/RimL family protein N-acetyltransferase